eukprot:jgi/Mesen1/618/ME000108S10778
MSKLSLAPGAPITFHRPVKTDDLDKHVEKPHVPRGTKAPSKERPEGTPGRETSLSVLQQHVAYFDRNHDGIVYPWETYAGFRALGFNIPFSLLAMMIINFSFSYFTLDSWIPSPLFPIYIRNIHGAKHGSDSGTYDNEGRYVTEKFEEIFSRFDEGNKGGLTFKETLAMTERQRVVMDPFGWFAAKFEWGTTWLLAADQDGLLRKEAVRGIFDGSFFEYVEKQRKKQS